MKKIKKEYYFIGLLLISFIILTFFVISGKTEFIDASSFNVIINIKSGFITKFLYVITTLGSTVGVISIMIITGLVFLKNKSFSDMKYVVANVGIGVILMQVLKHIIKRARPAWKWIVQGGFSYPSGHTISTLLLYGTLILIVNKKLDKKYSFPLTIFFSLMIILTGISRIYFGAHYMTDVLASFILGAIILIISNMFMSKEFNNDKDKIK